MRCVTGERNTHPVSRAARRASSCHGAKMLQGSGMSSGAARTRRSGGKAMKTKEPRKPRPLWALAAARPNARSDALPSVCHQGVSQGRTSCVQPPVRKLPSLTMENPRSTLPGESLGAVVNDDSEEREPVSVGSRAAAKAASRAQDEQALESGEKSALQLRQENSPFAGYGHRFRLRISDAEPLG